MKKNVRYGVEKLNAFVRVLALHPGTLLPRIRRAQAELGGITEQNVPDELSSRLKALFDQLENRAVRPLEDYDESELVAFATEFYNLAAEVEGSLTPAG